jgi:hypothetical protein
MNKSLQIVLCAGFLAMFLLPASAMVVEDYTVAVSSPTNEASGNWDLNWDYVYKYKSCSSVAVGEYWILTAAHVGDDGGTGTITIGDVSYYQQEVILHKAADDSEHSYNTDLALVRFDKPFPDYYPLYSGDFEESSSVPTFGGGGGGGGDPPDLSSPVDAVLVGYGFTGTVSTDYYTPGTSGNGVKRWGTQTVDVNCTTQTYSADITFTDAVCVQMGFSDGDTDYEAGLATYDSGGGLFVEEGGVWKLGGINTVTYSYTTTPDDSSAGMFAISVPEYETWITNTMATATDDDDSDGIPNEWEYAQSGSTVGVDASADTDDDGLTGLEEYQNDTTYDDSDTDDDGMPDGWEVAYSFDPTDASDGEQDFDDDTLVNSNEYTLGTDPSDPDMDGDAVLDGWEYYGTSNTVYGGEATSITNADSDADGLWDGVEMGVTNSNGYVTNPNSSDTDEDGIPDGWEVAYNLDPTDDSNDEADTDEDGFTDVDEWVAGTNPTNDTSFLVIDALVVFNYQAVTFIGSTNRKYQLLYTTNGLTDSGLTWITNGVPAWGEGPDTAFAITNTEDKVFYRIEALLP